MKTTHLLIVFYSGIICMNALSAGNNDDLIYEKIKKKQQRGKSLSYEDFAHLYPGCPEDSICTKEMGIYLKEYKKKITEVFNSNSFPLTSLKKLHKEFGIPINYLSKQESHKRYSSVLWNSACPHHREKIETKDKSGKSKIKFNQTIFKSLGFVGKVDQKFVYFKNNKSTNSIPHGKLAYLDPVYIQKSKAPYYLPHKGQPFYLDGKSLVFMQNYENFYFPVKVNSKGEWEITQLDKKRAQVARLNKREVKCPKEFEFEKSVYQGRYCLEVYNFKTKKPQIVSLPWTCM